MIENMKVRRFKEEDAQEVRNLIVRNFLEVNSKDYGISAMEKLAKAWVVRITTAECAVELRSSAGGFCCVALLWDVRIVRILDFAL